MLPVCHSNEIQLLRVFRTDYRDMPVANDDKEKYVIRVPIDFLVFLPSLVLHRPFFNFHPFFAQKSSVVSAAGFLELRIGLSLLFAYKSQSLC